MTATFLMRLSLGIAAMWVLMPRSEVTDGFFRIQLRVVLGLAVLTALLLSATTDGSADDPETLLRRQTDGRIFWLQCGMAATAYFGSICWALGRRRPGTISIFAIAGLGLLSLVADSYADAGVSGMSLQLIGGVSSALVLGSILTGMLLGHWYLTSPTMSTRPLRFFITMIVIACALRAVSTGIAWAAHQDLLQQTTQMIWISLRIAGAIIAPLIAAAMTHQVLKYRNTQSATGILFACLIMVFMGEMSAALLEGDLSVPF